MEAKLKQSYIEEIKFQTKMLNNLKRWLKVSIILSSLSFAFVLFGPSLDFVYQIIGMILSTIACVLILLGYKNGRNNVNKIIDSLNK